MGVIELDVVDAWSDATGMIFLRFKPCETHGLAEAKLVVEAHNRLADGVVSPVIADIRGITVGADREAREYYVSEESARLKLGMAMIADSAMQRMLGNIFFRMNRPPYPSKLFSNEDDARAWLETLQAPE